MVDALVEYYSTDNAIPRPVHTLAESAQRLAARAKPRRTSSHSAISRSARLLRSGAGDRARRGGSGAIVAIDDAQGAPHGKVDVQDIGLRDFYVWSGHKMLGPMGTGAVCGPTRA